MENLEVIRCTLSDINVLQEISIETFSDTFKKQNTQENLEQYLKEAYNKEQLRSELVNKHSFFFMLKQSEQVLGYLKINIEDAQTENIVKNGLEIERIYIRKFYLRQGYGKFLIQYAETLARKLCKESIWLGVWEYNNQAILFYKKLGFKKVSTHSFFMGDEAQTDLILSKML